MSERTEIQYQVKWEGRYSQCSFNSLASVLDHFYGVPDIYPSENDFKDALPLQMQGLFGWAPYTGHMAKSGKLIWNSQQVDDLDCEWFELKPKHGGQRTNMNYSIQFDSGELEKLKNKLLDVLEKGPLILWVPYGSGRFRFSSLAEWRNVKQVNINKYLAVIPFYTHSIVIGGYTNGRFRIFDCSDQNGVFLVPPERLLVNVVAMCANPAVERAAFLEGSAFHCCIFRK